MPELKISSKQAITLLGQLGVQVAEISAEDNAEFIPDDAIQTVHAEARKVLEPQIIEANKETVLSQVAGRAAGALQAKLARKFGIEKSELKGLDDEAMIEKAIAYYEGKLSKDTEGLREEMKNMAAAHGEKLSKREAELLEQIAEAQEKYKSHFITEWLQEEIKDITLPDGADRLAAAKLLHREISEIASINFDEVTKKGALRDKKNPELPLYNEGKTSELQVKDLATKIYGNLGMIQKDMRGTPPKGLPNTGGLPPANPTQVNAPSVVGSVDLVALANQHWK